MVRLFDRDGDGRAEDVATVVRGVGRIVDLAWRDSALWILEPQRLLRAETRPQANDTPRVQVEGFPGGMARAMAFEPGGDAVLVAIAGSCETCSPEDRGGVVRYDLRGGPPQMVARGLASPGGLAFNPATGELWVTDTGEPSLGEDLPPDELNVVRRGRDYGWPYCYGDRVPYPTYADGARCDGTEPPALLFPARSRPLGIAFGRGGGEDPWGRDATVVLLADTAGTDALGDGARVVRVRVRSARPVSMEDLLTGWGGEPPGRPVDVLVGGDGRLYVSDDVGGRIWRAEAPIPVGLRRAPAKGIFGDRAG